MKKISYLLLVTSVVLFAACSSDNNDPAEDFAKTVSGIYASEVIVSEDGEPANPILQDISISRSGENKTTLEIKDFAFGDMPVGDIKIENIVVTKKDNVYSLLPTSQNVTFILDIGTPLTITAKANLKTGTITGNKMVLGLTITDITIGGDVDPIVITVTVEGLKKNK